MPVLDVPVDRTIFTLLDRVLDEYHGQLKSAGVTFGILLATPKDKEDSALTHHGHPALAIIKITPYKQRVLGLPDVVVAIDDPWWRGAEEEQRIALLDHELEHVKLSKRKKDGAQRYDDMNRPKLKMRKHDIQFGWFSDVAARHGEASIEVIQAMAIYAAHKQVLFPFITDVTQRREKKTEKAKLAIAGATA
jgi:hypothetical protein